MRKPIIIPKEYLKKMYDPREEVIKAGRMLVQKGLVVRTWGNVSCRIDINHFALSPSGKDYFSVEREDIAVVATDTGDYTGRSKPSSEIDLHRESYMAKEDCKFILHTHQENATVVSAMGSAVLISRDTEIRCAEHGMPGTVDLAEKTVKVLMSYDAPYALMANHGAVIWGTDIDDALDKAEELEELCREFLKKTGVPESREALERFRKSGQRVMPAYIDDFAQMMGPAPEIMFDDAGRPYGKGIETDDRDAEVMLIEKNCRAMYGGHISGKGSPLERIDSEQLHRQYRDHYSKLRGSG